MLVNSPAHLRDRYRVLPQAKLVAALATTRPSQVRDATQADTLYSLRSLARRYQDLGEEIAGLEQRMLERATAANPALMAVKGVGPVIGAQLLITAGDNPDRLRSSASFTALCGTAPIPVSSGRTDRHRLSRGGDRQANTALHHIVKNRMSYDKPTRTYRDTHLAKGWTTKAVYRASSAPSPARSTVPWQAAARCPTTPTCGLPAGPRTSPSPPSRPNSGLARPRRGPLDHSDLRRGQHGVQSAKHQQRQYHRAVLVLLEGAAQLVGHLPHERDLVLEPLRRHAPHFPLLGHTSQMSSRREHDREHSKPDHLPRSSRTP